MNGNGIAAGQPEAARLVQDVALRHGQRVEELGCIPEERRQAALGVHEHRIDLVQPHLGKLPDPGGGVVMQHHGLGPGVERIGMRATGEMAKAQALDDPLECARQFLDALGARALLDERLCKIEVLHAPPPVPYRPSSRSRCNPSSLHALARMCATSPMGDGRIEDKRLASGRDGVHGKPNRVSSANRT